MEETKEETLHPINTPGCLGSVKWERFLKKSGNGTCVLRTPSNIRDGAFYKSKSQDPQNGLYQDDMNNSC